MSDCVWVLNMGCYMFVNQPIKYHRFRLFEELADAQAAADAADAAAKARVNKVCLAVFKGTPKGNHFTWETAYIFAYCGLVS